MQPRTHPLEIRPHTLDPDQKDDHRRFSITVDCISPLVERLKAANVQFTVGKAPGHTALHFSDPGEMCNSAEV